MMSCKSSLAALVLLLPVLGAAAESEALAGVGAPDLPPVERVIATLAALPEVHAAQQMKKAEEANRDRLIAGTHEWQARTSLTRRNVSGSGIDQGGPFHEWELAVERPWRSDRKAQIDQRVGDAGLLRAENAVGDALHEAARGLLRRWFELRRAEADATAQLAGRALWAQTQVTVARRVEAGDAARLDLELIQAQLAQADARVAEAAGRVRQARTDFDRAYPELAGVSQPGQCEPQADTLTLDDYMTRLFAEHHELAMAQAEFDRRMQLAERARADQQPDPVFGVRIASERGGAEHLAGVVVTLPLGGDNRTAATRSALAEAEAARDNVARVRRRLEGEVASMYATSQGLFQAWQATLTASERMHAVASLSERAYGLGELGLPEVLASRRQEQEARMAESSARNGACEVFYRLRLDTHALWPMEQLDHP
jgi:outer membrane protein TolC